MNIFAGFGTLGFVVLKELLENGYQFDLILTHKDGSGESVDLLSSKNGIDFSYSDLRTDLLLLNELKEEKINFLISVNYRYIIPKIILENSSYPLNIHGSLLPKYRGRTPHVWAIINGESKTGITCHIMEESVDTGDIYHQIEVEIADEDTGNDIIQKFKEIYPVCLTESLKKIHQGIKPIPQVEADATYFGKRIPEMGYVDFTKDKKSLINFIRAQSKPYPGAYCYLADGRKLIVHRAVALDLSQPVLNSIGLIFKENNQFVARVKDGFLAFTDFEIG
ncbi:methionyl-tRNA formyltransferase [Leptospira bourretii]|uniref:methionyl-tRNA formyltransferase n=1 Tax=Leptospira bourretii TaxID=2484962 RepID=UPI001090B248|nr:methionyl-tRNA formyltransferase [Leptospira bourretii]TGL19612.1 methionyl-tRNA formyltransferase [Leptospira bourretii]